MKKTIEVWLAMNEDGDFAAHDDKDAALEALADNYGYTGCRIVKLTVTMQPPLATEAAVNIPDEAGEMIEAEAEAESGHA